MRITKILGICLACLGSAACTKETPPLTAPSGEHPGYAEQYPARLGTLRARFAADEAKVRAALPELQPAAQKLGSADPATLSELFQLADAEGRSGAYADSALEAETVSRFIEEEKQPLQQKIAGAVSYAGRQKECAKECSDDLGGVAAGAAPRAIEKQLEERQQRLGELHRFVLDHEEELGKPNLEGAERQAAAIALLSHIVHVRLELYRRELSSSLSEAGDVESTLARVEKDSDAALADPKTSKSKRARAEKRKAAAAEARAALAAEVEQAKGAVEEMQQRRQKAVADYEQAFKALIQGLEQRAQK